MKILSGRITAALLGIALGTPAFAADLPRPTYKAPVYTAPAFTWSGFYIGANAGYGFGKESSDISVVQPGLATFSMGSTNTSPNGFIAGGQLGYNYQFGAYVLGIEGDWQYSGQKGSASILCPVALCGGPVTVDRTDKLTSFGTLRARLGYAFDSWLVYGTGGLAFGSFKSDTTVTAPGGGGVTVFSSSQTRTGWALGAGIEKAFASHWSWKLEYLYMDFGTFSTDNVLPPTFGVVTFHSNTRFTDNIVRAGVNYRF